MYTVKNLKENEAGNFDCLALVGGDWICVTISKRTEYEIHEESEWQDVKPCGQAEKDAHEAALERDAVIAEIAALDMPSYVIERALAGDNEAIKKINANEEKKALIRARL